MIQILAALLFITFMCALNWYTETLHLRQMLKDEVEFNDFLRKQKCQK